MSKEEITFNIIIFFTMVGMVAGFISVFVMTTVKCVDNNNIGPGEWVRVAKDTFNEEEKVFAIEMLIYDLSDKSKKHIETYIDVSKGNR